MSELTTFSRASSRMRKSKKDNGLKPHIILHKVKNTKVITLLLKFGTLRSFMKTLKIVNVYFLLQLYLDCSYISLMDHR